MTGLELLEGLSFVDERFIAEADTAKLGRNVPWIKILSVAACLCILFVGALALENIGHKSAETEAAAPAATMAQAPAETEAAMEEAAPLMPTDGIVEESAAEPVTIPGELHHVAFAHLRILNVQEDGSFEVYVEKVADEPRPFDAGVEMTLVIDPDMIPAADRTDTEYSGDVTVDMLVEIKNGAYDAGINTLYAEGFFAAARE